MSNELYVVRAPQYVGRPEKNIADWVIKEWTDEEYDFLDIFDNEVKEYEGVFYDSSDSVKQFANQVQKLIDIVQNGDRIFFIEGWNPSIPLLRYYLDSAQMDVKIYGIFHSSVWVRGEFFSNFKWAYTFESCLLKCFDCTFVATKYLQKAIFPNIGETVEVTGLPLPPDIQDKVFYPRKPIVIFNHRWCGDKRPEAFEHLATSLHDKSEFWVLTPKELAVKNPYIKVIFCKSRQEYLDNLQKGLIVFSSAELETFGYSVLEGAMSGCIPLLTRSACYPEIYKDEFLFSTDGEMIEKALQIIEHPIFTDPFIDYKQLQGAPKRMYEIIQR